MQLIGGDLFANRVVRTTSVENIVSSEEMYIPSVENPFANTPFFIPTPALFYPSGGCRCRPEENIFSTEGSRGGLEENIFPTEVVGTTWLADGSATDKLHINILGNRSKL